MYLGGERTRVEQPRLVLGRRTPFVGRAPELARLDAIFAEVRAGQARAVLMSGEAGLGKSRLRHEFLERTAGARVGLARGEESGEPFAVLRRLVATAIRGRCCPRWTVMSRSPPPMAARGLAGLAAGQVGRPLIVAVEDAHLPITPASSCWRWRWSAARACPCWCWPWPGP